MLIVHYISFHFTILFYYKIQLKNNRLALTIINTKTRMHKRYLIEGEGGAYPGKEMSGNIHRRKTDLGEPKTLTG